MAKRILVPIDGRDDSEAIVPIIAAMAHGGGASVRLVRISAIPDRVVGAYGRTIAYADQEMARLTNEALDDLHRIETQLDGVAVDSRVRFGDPATEIRLEAESFGADLIALAASRRGRLRSALSTGVAQRLIGKAPAPTLVLHGD